MQSAKRTVFWCALRMRIPVKSFNIQVRALRQQASLFRNLQENCHVQRLDLDETNSIHPISRAMRQTCPTQSTVAMISFWLPFNIPCHAVCECLP